MGKRRTDTFHQGERAENKARSEAKKPITAETPTVKGRIPPVTDQQRHAARIAVAARAHSADDCRSLLDALGLGET